MDSVIFLCEKPYPLSSSSIESADFTLARLSSGSPIPIKTRLFSLVSESVRYSFSLFTCFTISPAERFLIRPNLAVAQKAHPILQPTCEDIHAVYLFPSLRITASIRSPSESSNRNLTVPSRADLRTSITLRVVNIPISDSFSLSATDISVMSLISSHFLWCTHLYICMPRNLGIPRLTTFSCSSFRLNESRWIFSCNFSPLYKVSHGLFICRINIEEFIEVSTGEYLHNLAVYIGE